MNNKVISPATVRHWHQMWVYCGLKPRRFLKSEARKDFDEKYGKGPHPKWTHDEIQAYCNSATRAIQQGQALPAFARAIQ